jgi:hypothetical protein
VGAEWQTVSGGGIHVSKYDFGGNPINTIAVELGDGRLLVIGPGPTTTDAAFAELDALGEVVGIASPGAFHHVGMPKWRTRYPKATLYATVSGVKRIPKQHKKESLSLEPSSALAAIVPDHITIAETPGTKHADLHVVIRGDGDRCVWVTNEVIHNFAAYPESFVFRMMFKMFGVGPGLGINTLAMKAIGGNRKVLGEFFRGQLDASPPTCLVPSHGNVLTAPDLSAQLRAVFDAKL